MSQSPTHRLRALMTMSTVRSVVGRLCDHCPKITLLGHAPRFGVYGPVCARPAPRSLLATRASCKYLRVPWCPPSDFNLELRSRWSSSSSNSVCQSPRHGFPQCADTIMMAARLCLMADSSADNSVLWPSGESSSSAWVRHRLLHV